MRRWRSEVGGRRRPLSVVFRIQAVGSFGVGLRILTSAVWLGQRGKQDVADQRGFARAADAGEGDEAAQRNFDGEVVEIVAGGVGDR